MNPFVLPQVGKLWNQTSFTLHKNWPCVVSCLWQRGWVNAMRKSNRTVLHRNLIFYLPNKFSQSLHPPGCPSQNLILKVGAPIVHLCNLTNCQVNDASCLRNYNFDRQIGNEEHLHPKDFNQTLLSSLLIQTNPIPYSVVFYNNNKCWP